MFTHIKNLFQSRELLWSWTARTIRGRYQQSVLGWLWAVIQPVAMVAIFALIFTRFVPVDTGNTPYLVFSYVAMTPWLFLASSLTDMSESLVGNMGLVTKIYFPREALPVAAMLARLLDFAVATGLLLFLLVYYQVRPSWVGLSLLPIILATQITLILGVGLICAAANVFYRDIRSLLVLGLQVWFYASPIIYPVSVVPAQLRSFYLLNPMVGILESYRDILLRGTLPDTYLLPSIVVAVVVFLIGYWFFKRVEFQFADLI
jgi:lipopolysaccharide transport system permease protein